MKKYIIALLILVPLSLEAQWEIINDGPDLLGFLNTIDFVNEDVGWIGGNVGTLLKTTDGGENWNTINISDSISFKQIDFINESIGWAVCGDYWGGGGSVWKSIDGGISWINQLPDFSFSTLHCIDENNIYVVGGNKIYKTTNGGTNWVNVAPNLPGRKYNAAWFQDSQTGVVVGNYDDGTNVKGIILKTTNGGSNWNVTTVNQFNNIYDLQFLDPSNGYFRAHKDTSNFICKTGNMLTNWVIKTVNLYSIESYQFIDTNCKQYYENY